MRMHSNDLEYGESVNSYSTKWKMHCYTTFNSYRLHCKCNLTHPEFDKGESDMNYLDLLVRLSSDSMEYLGFELEYWFVFGAVSAIFFGIIAACIATNRGYGDESGKWFLVGLVLGLLGIVIAACLVPRNSEVSAPSSVNTIPKVNSNGVATSPEIENIEKLKKYKELLDMGAITQEEFDLKKQEILKG